MNWIDRKSEDTKSKKRQMIAIMLCLAIVVVALFSMIYIAHEANHECTGTDCPICTCIQQCENNLKQLGTGLAALQTAVAALVLCVLSIFLFEKLIPVHTLVSRKVRLDD